MNKMTIKVKEDPETKEQYLDLNDFKDLLDITKVHSCSFKDLGNKSLSIQFFDKDNNEIKLIQPKS